METSSRPWDLGTPIEQPGALARNLLCGVTSGDGDGTRHSIVAGRLMLESWRSPIVEGRPVPSVPAPAFERPLHAPEPIAQVMCDHAHEPKHTDREHQFHLPERNLDSARKPEAAPVEQQIFRVRGSIQLGAFAGQPKILTTPLRKA